MLALVISALAASMVSAIHPESDAVDSFCQPIPDTPIQVFRSWLIVHSLTTCLPDCQVLAVARPAWVATSETACVGVVCVPTLGSNCSSTAVNECGGGG